MFYLLLLVFSPLVYLIVVTPMSDHSQYMFGLISIILVFIMGHVKSRKLAMTMMLFSLLTSTRYLYFRTTQTLIFDSYLEAGLGIGLFIAEIYAYIMLFLGYLQSTFPLNRKIVPLPEDQSTWPTVDVYIPSYNEPLDVVRDAVLAAQCIDYPKDKFKVYLLDDGNRQEFAEFAADAGVGYITRTDNNDAKAGNLNHAMTLTNGELVCIFDCDHIATRIFLQATVGAFIKDSNLSLIQTPHYYYSDDPFERNLYGGRDIPNEGELFYGPVQQGNDFWNATFFCGSCAVIRRSALDEIGGIATETVTEDAHTALKLQRLGWDTAFLPYPLVGGLATERLALHVIQRNRWARGMIQIFRLDNPLLGRGLKWQQRLCYLSAMMYFLFPLPRVIFLTAPMAYLLFDLNIIHAQSGMIFAYALPHFVMCTYVASRLTGRYRYSFWGDVYDITLAMHLLVPTVATLFSPKVGSFNVTDKGGTLDRTYFDLNVVRPHLIIAVALIIGLSWGVWRTVVAHYAIMEPSVIMLNVGWATYSLIFLLASIAVGRETRQVRKTVRLDVEIPAVIHYADGVSSITSTENVSMGGCLVKIPNDGRLGNEIEEIELRLASGVVSIPVKKSVKIKNTYGLMFDEVSVDHRRQIVRVVLSRADAWVREHPRAEDKPLRSLATIIVCTIPVLFSLFKRKPKPKRAPVGAQAQTQKGPQGEAV
ncbi:UDP-forming cellulose synthase catalytic subunit [Vibrio sp. JC009]|nr:UDP-forming cellulose synthase catalytic subunit [Vibrio sp. JC009]WED20653.1 UDP-forming cellulose synthase catalytic subunit [Vibrio sp. JC009]